MIDGYSGFLFFDKKDMPEVALHWEKHFEWALEKHNRIYKRAVAENHSLCMPSYLLSQYGEIGNESENTSIPNRAFWYRSYVEYIHSFRLRWCKRGTGTDQQTCLTLSKLKTRKTTKSRIFSKIKTEVILLRMDEKIYQFMPRYAMIRQKTVCRKNAWKRHKYSILRSFNVMIKILFVCHGSTSDSRELAALVGQNRANRGIWESGLLRFYYEWGNEKRACFFNPFFRD